MLNIEIQSCGLLMLLLLFLFYCRLPKLSTRTKWVFFAMIIVSIVCLVCDILSVVAIRLYYKGVIHKVTTKFFCKLYIVYLLLTVYCGLLYICADFCQTDKAFRKHAIAFAVVAFAIICTMAALPIGFKEEDAGRAVFSYGISTQVGYGGFCVMFIAMIVYLVLGRKRLQRRRLLAVVVWLSIWLSSGILQFLLPRVLIVSFSASLGIFIIYIMIENPVLNLDKNTPHFNTRAMRNYFTYRYLNGRKFSLIITRFKRRETSFYVNNIPHKYIFVDDNNVFLLYKSKEDMDEGLKILSGYISKESIFVLEDSSIVNSTEELVLTLHGAGHIHRLGGGKVVYVDKGTVERVQEAMHMRELIARAIEERSVEVFYQPIYSVKDKKFVSAEALARIRDKEGNIVPPFKFIPVAEFDGTIIALGKIIMEKVCKLLSEHSKDGRFVRYMEVNLSVVQGEDKQLADDVVEIFTRYNVPPEKINLEITESASTSGREQLLDNMSKLISRGLEFSLDDFGTGQSNLDYMAMMPVNIVKFDRTMTNGYFESKKTRFIMSAAIKMVHDMGLSVVVEGIETKEQFEEMSSLDIEYIQGYYFAKPMPQEEFLSFIREKNV